MKYKNKATEYSMKYTKRINQEQPWRRFLRYINWRCNTAKDRRYYLIGIKNYLKVEDLKNLWFRDEAFKLQKPSIDRIDSTKNYTFDNCRFIEFSLNSSLRAREDKSGWRTRMKKAECVKCKRFIEITAFGLCNTCYKQKRKASLKVLK